MLNKVQKVIIRSILKQANFLKKENKYLYLQNLPNPAEFSKFKTFKSINEALYDIIPTSYNLKLDSRVVTGDILKKQMEHVVRNNSDINVDDSFAGLKLVNNQVIFFCLPIFQFQNFLG